MEAVRKYIRLGNSEQAAAECIKLAEICIKGCSHIRSYVVRQQVKYGRKSRELVAKDTGLEIFTLNEVNRELLERIVEAQRERLLHCPLRSIPGTGGIGSCSFPCRRG